MDLIKQLEYKYKIEQAYKKHRSFDIVFHNKELLCDLYYFLEGRIGQIWLKKPLGKQFKQWQIG